MALDFHWIAPNIAQGSYPKPPSECFREFDTLVLCAEELQAPGVKAPKGKRIVRFGFDDDPYRPIPQEVGQMFHVMSQGLAREVSQGRKVLITCAMGLNRSGIITALTTMYAYRMAPNDVVKLMRARRSKEVLFNPIFERWVLSQRI